MVQKYRRYTITKPKQSYRQSIQGRLTCRQQRQESVAIPLSSYTEQEQYMPRKRRKGGGGTRLTRGMSVRANLTGRNMSPVPSQTILEERTRFPPALYAETDDDDDKTRRGEAIRDHRRTDKRRGGERREVPVAVNGSLLGSHKRRISAQFNGRIRPP